MGSSAEKFGAEAWKMGATLGKLGAVAKKSGAMVGKWGAAIRQTGAEILTVGAAVRKMGAGAGKLGTDVGELGAVLRNWGHRREHCAGDGSGRVWGIKCLRSGCELFAQWLSIRLPTVTRMLMECEQEFSKNDGGRQERFGK